MPQRGSTKPISRSARTAEKTARPKTESRHTVALSPDLTKEVQRYAQAVDLSLSKAIGALVRLGLESHATRKREFFKKLKQNLATDDAGEQDRLVDQFRALILGR